MYPRKSLFESVINMIDYEKEKEVEWLQKLLNSTNMVINSSLIESFYKKAKSLLESESNEVRLIKKTELVIWLQEQENKVDEVVKKLTNDGAEVTVGTVPIG
jgi:lipoate synthase